jgi:5-methylcytosine-specific restriction endonuclease McrA
MKDFSKNLVVFKRNDRPTCINPGCGKPVTTHSGKITDPNPQWRVHCTHCQSASYGRWAHAEGVTPYKSGKCSNTKSRLGFQCPTNYKKAPWAVGITDVDHINGNHSDNRPENLQELCPMCHKQKSKLEGNNRGFRYLAT